MGVKLNDIKELFEYIKLNIGNHFDKLSILELGEQEFKIFGDEKTSGLLIEYLNSDPRPYNKNLIINNTRIGLYAKDYLENFFKEVVSMSYNGRCPKTLKNYIYNNLNFKTKFDVLLNIEYTNNLGENDDISDNILYKSFKNIHNNTKKGGLIFNILPCFINKENANKNWTILYSTDFFDELSRLCNYKIIYNNVKLKDVNNPTNHYVYCYYIKKNNNNFIEENEFMKLRKYLIITDKMKQNPRKCINSYKII